MFDQRIKQSFEKSPQYKSACLVIEKIEAKGFEAYIVGGAVRDALLGVELHDFDMATNADPEDLLEIFKDYKVLNHGIAFGTLGVVVDETGFEITTYRGEAGYTDLRHPDKVEFLKSKDEDLKRRDFTINAMMFHPERGLYDPLGGYSDLEDETLKAVGDASERFKEDSLRILRLFRFSVSLGFKIEEATMIEAEKNLGLLKGLSKERVFAEIDKALSKNVDWVQFKNLEKRLLSKKYLNVDFKTILSTAEKAYVLFSFKPAVEDIRKYILPKSLREQFDFFNLLSEERDIDRLKTAVVKKMDSNTEPDLVSLYLKELSLRGDIEVIDEEAFKGYPSKDLAMELESIKRSKFGKELGDALLEAKKSELFIN